MVNLRLKSGSRRVVQDSSTAAEKSKHCMGKSEFGGDEDCNYCCLLNLSLELLREVLLKVEDSESKWPDSKHMVACYGVCKRWREVMKEVVKNPEVSGKITFPISVKQALGDDNKFLLAARKCRCPVCTDYMISLHADDMLKGSDT